ncbi:MAG: hypothetical protein P4N41_16540 [Negativicutes bacterium]|nr:hypothetical protein [Negativicutes bacterium]
MDIEKEILVKVGKILLSGALIVTVVVTVAFFGARQWFWHQVDQEVAYQKERLTQTAFGDIVSRSEVRYIQVWQWNAKIDIYVFHPTDKVKTVSINVSSRGANLPDRSFRAQVTGEGYNTSWSGWIQSSAAEPAPQ